ncbi:MAG TPA: hypothetical protein VHP35_18450 [Terriglobia bacterium]|nr:hypothetical protein [Terriglobia bacterium]
MPSLSKDRIEIFGLSLEAAVLAVRPIQAAAAAVRHIGGERIRPGGGLAG